MFKKTLFLLIISLSLLFTDCYSQTNEVLTVIQNRKSVRNFTGESVSKDDLNLILKAGMCAPTAVNKQPWNFVVVTDRATLDLLAEKLPSAKMLSKAGAAIIICAIPEKANGGLVEYAVIDCSLAGENILLAVESLGLGGIWTACYPNEDRMKTVRTILGIPENIIPLNVMPIGHPTGEDKPKDKFNPGNIRWEKW
ncbi:MAG: nitroreductase family protein [Ignavibacteriae bacterium]|nr:nitroreductase family protein [Ignavibacteriota bacterium]